MVHTVALVAGVLVVAGIAAAFLVLVVSDVRRSREPVSPDAQRALDAQRAAERRVNQGAGPGAV